MLAWASGLQATPSVQLPEGNCAIQNDEETSLFSEKHSCYVAELQPFLGDRYHLRYLMWTVALPPITHLLGE